ncbi:hypothetical protein G8759_25145 [Spirosoma aureum]|uniref:Uncharacterized protein n=1 Tax=Spirosoma aureum TaxID=2692134 RepID=A0A6G9ATZ2_9BACT|nr:hypothetical protein [Spirosoma aureum]QIP15683.1 hypothetical protein G8759_25145 [Spirosoma aureum]
MEKDFIIIKVSWRTRRIRNYDATEENAKTLVYFKALINFLQNNELTTRVILPDNGIVTDETCIRKSDLTEFGYQLFAKKHFDKWVDAIFDRGKDPTDVKALKKALQKIVSSQ